MFFLIINDLSSLDPAARLEKVLKPLLDGLVAEGLGEVLELESLVQEIDGEKVVMADEITIEVNDLQKGRMLINRILLAVGAEINEP